MSYERPVWSRVISDMVSRNELGAEKYNKYLTTATEDNMLKHAYEEALDLAVYLKTKLLQDEENTLIQREVEKMSLQKYLKNEHGKVHYITEGELHDAEPNLTDVLLHHE